MATQRFLRMLAIKHFRLKPVLLCLFMGLVMMVLAGGNYSAPARSTAKVDAINQELAQLAFLQAYSSPSLTLSMPGEATALPGDREIPNENEPEEDTDSDVHFVLDQCATTLVADELITVNWAPYISGFQHTNAVVPLFVLHHSWKTFLS